MNKEIIKPNEIITSVRVTKEVALALKKIAVLDEKSINDWLRDLIVYSFGYSELVKLAPSLAARKTGAQV